MKIRLYFLILPVFLCACKTNDLAQVNSKFQGTWISKKTKTDLPFVSDHCALDTLVFNNFLNHNGVFLLSNSKPMAGKYKVLSTDRLWISWVTDDKKLGSNYKLKYTFQDAKNLIIQYNINTPRGKFYVNSFFQKVQ